MITTHPIQILKMLLWAIACGAFMGAVYDLFRLTRVFLGYHYLPEKSKVTKSKLLTRFPIKPNKSIEKQISFKITLFIEDIIFTINFASVFIVVSFYGDSGRFRVLAFALYIFGFVLYYFTLGKISVLFFDVWVLFLRAMIKYVVYYLMLPLKFIWKKISYFVTKTIEKIRMRIYNNRESRVLLNLSQKGMLKKDL